MRVQVLTLFPEMFDSIASTGMLGKAADKGLLEIEAINIRDYSTDKHNRADDAPFGGGAGMVMLAEPVFGAIDAASAAAGDRDIKMLYMSPKGAVLNESKIRALAEEDELIILCGHYEGIDERILEAHDMEEVSIGDYILTGGEPAAIVLIDAVARLIPGVLGNDESMDEESVYSGLLEYPQYTKPREYAGLKVPEVLLSGNHKAIELWKFEEALKLTKRRRPDLFEAFLKNPGELSKEAKKIMEKVKNMV